MADEKQTLSRSSAHEDDDPRSRMRAWAEKDEQSQAQDAERPAQPYRPSVPSNPSNQRSRHSANWHHGHGEREKSSASQDGRVKLTSHQVNDKVVRHGEQLERSVSANEESFSFSINSRDSPV